MARLPVVDLSVQTNIDGVSPIKLHALACASRVYAGRVEDARVLVQIPWAAPGLHNPAVLVLADEMINWLYAGDSS